MITFNSNISFVTNASKQFGSLVGSFPTTSGSYKMLLEMLKGDFLNKSDMNNKFVSCFIEMFNYTPDDVIDNSFDDPTRVVHYYDVGTDQNTLYNVISDTISSIRAWAQQYSTDEDDGILKFSLTTAAGRLYNLFVNNDNFGYSYNGENFWVLSKVDATRDCAMRWYCRGNDGIYDCIIDIIADINTNAALNSLYYQACHTYNNSLEYASALKAYVDDKDTAVKQQANAFISAYTSSGVFGVVSLIKDLYQGLNDVGVSQNSLIDFTNNDVFTPAEYISGLMNRAMSGIGYAVAAIVAIASPILGAIAAGASWVFNQLLNIQYDYDTQTLSTIQDDFNFPVTPFAAYQKDLSESLYAVAVNMSDDDIDAKRFSISCGQSHAPFILDGGPMQWIVSSDASHIRIEGHVDLRDRTAYLKTWLQANATETSLSSVAPFYYAYNINTSHSIIDWWRACISDEHVQPNTLQPGDNGLLSSDDDLHMRLIIGCNLLWFIMMQSLVSSHPFATIGAKLQGSQIDDHYSIAVPSNDVPGLSNIQWINSTTGYSMYLDDDCWHSAIAVSKLVHDLCYWAFHNDLHYFDQSFSWSGLIQLSNYLIKGRQVWVSGDDFLNSMTLFDINFDTTEHFLTSFVRGSYIFNQRLTFPLKVPKYNRQSFWSNVLAFSVGALATAITLSTVAIKVKLWANRQQLIRNGQIEKAWQDYTDNPTNENAKKYRRLVLKNNIMATLFGGTKYSKQGYWVDPSGNSTGSNFINSLKESSLNPFATNSLSDKLTDDVGDIITAISNSETNVIKKITG